MPPKREKPHTKSHGVTTQKTTYTTFRPEFVSVACWWNILSIFCSLIYSQQCSVPFNVGGNSSVSTGYRLVDRGTMPSRVKVPFATKFSLVPSQCIVLPAGSSKQRRILECMGHYLQSPIHCNVPVFKLRATLPFWRFYSYNSVERIPQMGEGGGPNWNSKFSFRFSK